MVDQAQVNPPGQPESPPQAVARGTAEFLHDVLTLAELQVQLLTADSREGLKRLLWPAIALASGAVLGLSCLPLALVVLALTLDEVTTLSQAQAFGVALGVGLLLAIALSLTAIWYLRHRLAFLERSRAEWQRNVRWVKDVLKRLGKGVPKS